MNNGGRLWTRRTLLLDDMFEHALFWLLGNKLESEDFHYEDWKRHRNNDLYSQKSESNGFSFFFHIYTTRENICSLGFFFKSFELMMKARI